MPMIRTKTVSEDNKGDLIIDVISDLIVEDVTKDTNTKINSDDAIDMRARFNKMDKLSEAWYKLQEARGKL